MRKLKLGIPAIAFLTLLFCFSCQKETEPLVVNQPVTPDPTSHNYVDPVSEFVIAQNYLIEVVNIVLTEALFSPEMHGLQEPGQAEVRNCPSTSFQTISGQGTLMTVNFDDILGGGTGCSYTHPLGGVSSPVLGTVTLLASGPITQPAATVKVRFDELRCGDKRIKFLGGCPLTRELKVEFTNPASGDFSYNVKLSGELDNGMGGCMPNGNQLDKAHFEVTCINSGTRTLIYPSYSGVNSVFNFDYTNAGGTAPEFTYASLAAGCYEVEISAMTGFYYDSGNNLIDDYRINRDVSAPIIYKPNCKWIQSGKLLYTNIPTVDIYTDGGRDINGNLISGHPLNDPNKLINYGVDSGGSTPMTPGCDGWVEISGCQEGPVGNCTSGATYSLFNCP